MRDVIYIAILVAFFALAAGFVQLCDRILRAGESAGDVIDEPERLAA